MISRIGVLLAAFLFVVGGATLVTTGLDEIGLDSWRAGLVIGILLGVFVTLPLLRIWLRRPSASLDDADLIHADWSDTPLTDPADDALGHARFARKLAEAISSLHDVEGYVIGLDGEWGSGKSTILNFVVKAFRNLEKPPHVIRINPWLFAAGEDDLVRKFLLELETTLGSRKFINPETRQSLRELAMTLRDAPVPGAKWLETQLSLYAKERDVRDAKREVNALLRKNERLIVVIIDDLDRLSGDEIRQVFQAVKALADFPNLVYLVSYDREYVVRALADTSGFGRGGSGSSTEDDKAEAYLEKIIQAQFKVPRPGADELWRMLGGHLDKILEAADKDSWVFDLDHWAEVHEGLRELIRTPRHIIRLINILRLTYTEDVRRNADFADFVGIETLKMVAPAIHASIERNPDLFLKVADDDSSKERLRRLAETIDSVNLGGVKTLLMAMFPVTARAWRPPILQPAITEEDSYRGGRIAHEVVFPYFFMLSLAADAIPPEEMRRLLTTATEESSFSEALLTLRDKLAVDGTTRMSTALDLLENYTGSIPLRSAEVIIESLLNVGDQLVAIKDRRRWGGLLEKDNETRIGRIVFQLLRRFDNERAYKTLQRAVANGLALSTIVNEVKSLQPNQRERPEIVTAKQADELKVIALDMIRSAARERELLDTPSLAKVLYRWLEWAQDEVRPWVEQATATDEGLLIFLTKMIGRSIVETAGRARAQERWSFKIAELENFIDTVDVYNRVTTMHKESLSGEELRAVEAFIQAFERPSAEDDFNDTLE